MGGRVLVRTPAGWETTALGRRALAVAERIEASVRELAEDGDGAAVQGMVRIAAPEAFTSAFLVPAMAALQARHPALAVEIITATQRARQNRSGVDLEIVVGRPQVHRAFATPDQRVRPGALCDAGLPRARRDAASLADLARHPLIYYVESALQVDELDRAVQPLPASPASIRSTSVFAHVEAAAASAGIGLLPDFLGDADARLVRVLDGVYSHPLAYWAVTRDEGPRNPLVGRSAAARSASRSDRPEPRPRAPAGCARSDRCSRGSSGRTRRTRCGRR